MIDGRLLLGTSSWTGDGWVGSFYPPGCKPADFLGHYSKQFDTVEIDATFYRIPSAKMVEQWRERTPAGFTFAAKLPQSITHERVLVDADGDLKAFLEVMELLGEKLGPLLFQFPYFNKKAFARPEDFIARLAPFLAKLPKDFRYAVEIRNKAWIAEPFLDLLRKHRVALALIDHPWMTPIQQLAERFDLATTDFSYIRFLGDRKGIEQRTKVWDKIIVNREREMETWTPEIQRLLQQRLMVYLYFNNHYAGNAPGSIRLFREVWERLAGKGTRESTRPARAS